MMQQQSESSEVELAMSKEECNSLSAAVNAVMPFPGQADNADSGANTCSPCFSSVGLRFDRDRAALVGIDLIHQGHGHASSAASILPGFLRADERVVSVDHQVAGVAWQHPEGETRCVFYDREAWLFESTATGCVRVTISREELRHPRVERDADGLWWISGYVPARWPVDTRSQTLLLIGLRCLAGEVSVGDSALLDLTVSPAGGCRLAVACSLLDPDPEPLRRRLRDAPADGAAAIARVERWLAAAAGTLWGNLAPVLDGASRELAARCIHCLTQNTCAWPTWAGERLMSTPSRSKYPVHFLWDACFHVIGLIGMAPAMARDALLIFADTITTDGRLGCTISPVRHHPAISQPPLVGWATQRLVAATDDDDLAAAMLPALRRNTAWWLRERRSRHGLLFTADHFESGWDRTRRLAGGPAVLCDMNSYLLSQMRATAWLARRCGDAVVAEADDAAADAFAATMLDVLYDERENRFRGVDCESDAPCPVSTLADFLPLWAGVPLAEERARAMIERRLLDPRRFFGAIPFPTVAYDDPTFGSDHGWNGSVWMPTNWLMLEILASFDYDAELSEARKRMLRLLHGDPALHELWDALSGRGLAAEQQTWTAAIGLRLLRDESVPGKDSHEHSLPSDRRR